MKVGGDDGEGGVMQTMALDLNQHTTEATINQDGSIIITGMDGSHSEHYFFLETFSIALGFLNNSSMCIQNKLTDLWL